MATGQISNAAFADALQRARQLAEKINTTQESSKRPLEDSEYQSAKRITTVVYNNGVPLNTGSSGMDPILTENWSVPDQMVGLIIGRGGEQITNIQAETSCRVQMVQGSSPYDECESNGQTDRPCTLTGTKNAIDNAKRRIQELINKAHGRPPPNNGSQFNSAGMGGGGMPSVGGAGQIVMEMLVPGPKVGLIIGKNGETLKGIQERAGVRMTIIQESNTLTQQEKPLRIIGEPSKCEYAKELIEQLLASKDDAPPGYGGGTGGRPGGFRTGGPRQNDYGGQQKSLGEVIVPRMAVGVIIGKGGDMIKRIQQDSGARVQFKLGEDPNGPERTALVTGSPEQIQHATQIITELVQNALAGPGGASGGMGGARGVGAPGKMGNSMQQQQVFYMHVPSTKTGLIIGKGGETIKQINQESGAHVELSRDPPPNEFEKIFIIKGSPQAIHHAQHLIRVKVGDIPPGTPVPPFAGGYVTPQQQSAPAPTAYPQAYQYNSSDPNAAAWAAYYAATQYAQYPQAQAAGGAPQAYYQSPIQGAAPGGGPPQSAAGQAAQPQQPSQAAGAAPSINPQTGQPDYSAQWAEYYRSLGMHDQAAVIEQQAKANQAAAQGVHAPQAATQLQPAQPPSYAPYGVAAQPGAPAAQLQPAYGYAPQAQVTAAYQYQQQYQ